MTEISPSPEFQKTIAVIGYGRIAGSHVPVLRACGWDVCAAVNRSEVGRARARDEGGIKKTYATIAAMLDELAPDAFLVTASFVSIPEVMRKLVPLGRPILCEKPPALNLASFDELVALVEEHNTPVVVGLNRRHYSVIKQALADLGGPDAVTSVLVEWSENPASIHPRFGDYGLQRFIFANGIHGLDLLTHFGGPPTDVRPLVRGDPQSGQISLSFSAKTEKGVLLNYHSTWEGPGGWRLVLCGKDRRYTFAPLEGGLKMLPDRSTESIVPDAFDAKFKAGFWAQAQHFGAVANGEPNLHDLASARPAMVLAEALTNVAFPTA